MRAFEQIRQWLRDAPRAHVWTTVVAFAAALTLVVVSFVPTASVRAPDATDEIATGPGPASPAEGPTLPPQTLPAPGAPSALPTGGGPPGEPVNTPTDGGNPVTQPRPPEPLRASEVGITEDTVTIGFLLVNVFGLAQAGYALGFRDDIEDVVAAYVDEANQHGGLWGRRIVARMRRTDPVSPDDQNAACNAMARDAPRPFGVVDSATLIYSSTQRCFTQVNRVPLAHSYPMSHEFQAAAGGLDVAANRDLTRIAKEWAASARSLGWISGRGEAVGIFTDKCEPSNSVLRRVFVPMLESLGTAEPLIAETDCDPRAQQTQVPNAVAQMNLAHITHVFMATSYVGVQNFLENARGQGYKPKYFVSDYDGLVNDFFAKNFPPDQWDRVQGVTTLLFGARSAGRPPAPGTQRCSAILRAHGLRGLDNIENQDAEAGALCEEFEIMLTALRLAGPNPTRASYARAVQRIGSVQTATVHSVRFAPGKFSGGDDVVTVEWRRECTCYVQTSAYRPGRY